MRGSVKCVKEVIYEQRRVTWGGRSVKAGSKEVDRNEEGLRSCDWKRRGVGCRDHGRVEDLVAAKSTYRQLNSFPPVPLRTWPPSLHAVPRAHDEARQQRSQQKNEAKSREQKSTPTRRFRRMREISPVRFTRQSPSGLEPRPP